MDVFKPIFECRTASESNNLDNWGRIQYQTLSIISDLKGLI